MEPFIRLTAVAAPLDLANVDTDRILPARFLRKPRSGGYGGFLFHDLRLTPGGAERPDFVLNLAAYREARILVAVENFGCGSSREGAVWALLDRGFRAVIAPSFGDIFRGNCFNNGILPVVLPGERVAALQEALHASPGARMTIDLDSQIVVGPDGAQDRFAVDPFRKECLLRGRDEIALTLEHEAAIAAYESRRRTEFPWLAEWPPP